MQLERVHPDLVPYVGSPEPKVVSKDGQTIVLFRANRAGERGWGILDCVSLDIRFGGPSDEDIEDHPLSAIGLEPYGFFLVRGSPWVDQISKTVANPQDLQHLIATFHDNLFECVARSFTFSFTQGTPERIYHEFVRPLIVPPPNGAASE
jgi:hypothetical protein